MKINLKPLTLEPRRPRYSDWSVHGPVARERAVAFVTEVVRFEAARRLILPDPVQIIAALMDTPWRYIERDWPDDALASVVLENHGGLHLRADASMNGSPPHRRSGRAATTADALELEASEPSSSTSDLRLRG